MREPLSEIKKITIIELYRAGGNNTIAEISRIVEASTWQVDKVIDDFLKEKKNKL